MNVASLAFAALLSVPAPPGPAITWEASALVGPGRQSLGKGTKTYSPERDIVVQQQEPGRDGSPAWLKSIALDDTFGLGASVHREKSLGGIGLVVFRRGDENGFSWEWFDRVESNVYERRQGTGRVMVSTRKGPDHEELEAVEFLDDTTLRYLDDMRKPPGTHTHELVIRKGSVLRFADPKTLR